MSTVMLMEWTGVTQDQYNQVMRALDLDKTPPTGGILHVAGFQGGTLRVLDLWESQQAFEKFQRERLTAAVQKAGITSQPKTQFYPAHNIYVPNIETIRKTGSTAMPSAA
jgi:heme-degrading monooxygenase HmoA